MVAMVNIVTICERSWRTVTELTESALCECMLRPTLVYACPSNNGLRTQLNMHVRMQTRCYAIQRGAPITNQHAKPNTVT